VGERLKLLSFIKFDHTADLWDYTVDNTNPNQSPTYTYFYSKAFSLAVAGRAYVDQLDVITTQPLKANHQLRNLRDKKGNLLLPVVGGGIEYVYQVNEVGFQENPFGFSEYYRYRCRRVAVVTS
jgi:hypothetical protein